MRPSDVHFLAVSGACNLIASDMERLSLAGRVFMLDAKYSYVHSCPTNLGTGMRASVHVDLPGYSYELLKILEARCGTRGEYGGPDW